MRSILDSFEQGKKNAQKYKESFDRSQNIVDAFEDEFIKLNFDSCLITNEIDRFSERVLGPRVSKKFSHESEIVTMIGPERIGKTTTAMFLSHELNKAYGDNYSQYICHNDKFWDWWENTDFENTQVLFFSRT